MTKAKITLADFASSTELQEHSRKSRAVARALDEKADVLPYAKTFTSYEFEDFLSQLTPSGSSCCGWPAKDADPSRIWQLRPTVTRAPCRGTLPS